MDELEPLKPERGIEMYLTERRGELAEETLFNQRGYLTRFVEWCDEQEIGNMNELSGRDLYRFRQWRAEQLAQSSLQTNLSAVRKFIEFCESIDGVEKGLAEKMLVPPRPGNTRDEMLEPEQAEQVLSFLDQYHYASRHHALIFVLWHTGMRMGAAQSLDLTDFDRDSRTLELVHRPDKGTTLKNCDDGERYVAISEEGQKIVAGYIDHKRREKTDEYGRKPLFTTKRGRISKNTIQQTTYKFTRPCVYASHCPHDYDPEECDWTGYHGASKCPSSLSPHPIRRGSITYQLTSGPTRAVGDRCDVSNRVLDEHYDRRSERDRMKQRREVLDI